MSRFLNGTVHVATGYMLTECYCERGWVGGGGGGGGGGGWSGMWAGECGTRTG